MSNWHKAQMRLQQEQLSELLGKFLGKKRMAHSISVAKNAAKLARLYAPDKEQDAWIAGLLHDHAKKLEGRRFIKVARDFDIEVCELEEQEPSLLHGKVGAAMLKGRFGIETPRVCLAIADHVTGRPGMGLLSKLLYVADQIADDREFEGVAELRTIAKVDLEQAVLEVSKNKLTYVLSKGRPLMSLTVDLYNSLLGTN